MSLWSDGQIRVYLDKFCLRTQGFIAAQVGLELLMSAVITIVFMLLSSNQARLPMKH